MDFTAIDFETANKNKISACQIGVVVVRNNKIINKYAKYIKPPNSCSFLKEFTENIHGINREMVKNAPYFNDLWNTISYDIVSSPIVVAHNANFDRRVLKSLLEFYKIDANVPEFYCTLIESRKRINRIDDYRLSTIAKLFNIPLNHHEALSDAEAAAKIAIIFNN